MLQKDIEVELSEEREVEEVFTVSSGCSESKTLGGTWLSREEGDGDERTMGYMNSGRPCLEIVRAASWSFSNNLGITKGGKIFLKNYIII